jgi:hypothetical protein
MIVSSGLLVVIILAVCQASKLAGLNGRWIPLAAIVLGVVAGFVWQDLTLVESVITGLGAVGLWEVSTKTLLNK